MQGVRDVKIPKHRLNLMWLWDLNLYCQHFLGTEPRNWYRNWSFGNLEQSKCKTTLEESSHNAGQIDSSQKKEGTLLWIALLFSVLYSSLLIPPLHCNFVVLSIRGGIYFSTSLMLGLTVWLALANGLLMDMNQAKVWNVLD